MNVMNTINRSLLSNVLRFEDDGWSCPGVGLDWIRKHRNDWQIEDAAPFQSLPNKEHRPRRRNFTALASLPAFDPFHDP